MSWFDIGTPISFLLAWARGRTEEPVVRERVGSGLGGLVVEQQVARRNEAGRVAAAEGDRDLLGRHCQIAGGVYTGQAGAHLGVDLNQAGVGQLEAELLGEVVAAVQGRVYEDRVTWDL